MLRDGLSIQLLAVASVCSTLVVAMLRRALPLRLALVLGFLKSWLPFVYFAFFFDGQWTFIDDIVYLQRARNLLDQGFHPILSLLDIRFFTQLAVVSEGIHVFYAWWNILALWMLGDHYWAPVYLNVLVSAWASLTLNALLAECGLPDRYRIGAVAFFSAFPDLLAWTSVLNLKDILVMAFSLTALRALLAISSGRARWNTFVSLGSSLSALMFLRYYIPALLVGAAVTWVTLSLRAFRRPWVIFLIGVSFCGVAAWVASHAGARDLAQLRVENLAFGFVRFVLTPQPWSLDQNYTFLLIPAIVNWALSPLLLFGAVRLWRDAPELRLLLVYLVMSIFLYAIVPEIQGPRHRVQLEPIIALAMFHGVYRLLAEARVASRSSGVPKQISVG